METYGIQKGKKNSKRWLNDTQLTGNVLGN